MESKRHKVFDVKDMIKCTNEGNIDNFLADLKSYLEAAHELNKLAELVAVKEEDKVVDTTGFVWIDDGKHDQTINIGIKE